MPLYNANPSTKEDIQELIRVTKRSSITAWLAIAISAASFLVATFK